MTSIYGLDILRCNRCFKYALNQLKNRRSLSYSNTLRSSDNKGDEKLTGTEKLDVKSKTDEGTNVTTDSTNNNNTKSLNTNRLDVTKLIDSQIQDLDIPPVNYRKQHYDNPIERTLTIIKDDIAQYFSNKIRKIIPKSKSDEVIKSSKPKSSLSFLADQKEIWPSSCDVLIVGGGIVGMSIAYHLKEKTSTGLDVVVVEKDNSYSQASTVRSVGGIRQQFSVPENIQLSQYGMEFLRQSKRLLSIDGEDPVDVSFHPNGYLTLASEAGFEQLKENFMIQREVGAKVQFLSPAHIKDRFPWMNVDGIAAGVLGLENEGWFDPWSFLIALRHKSCVLGANYVHAEFKKAEYNTDLQEEVFIDGVPLPVNLRLNHAIVKLPNGEERTIKFALMIIAAGAWSGEIGRRLGLGTDKKRILNSPIPIEPRKRFVYCIHSPNGPGLHSPLVIDPDGTYFRREGLGDIYLCGQSPLDEPSTVDLDVDENFFEQNVWPTIAHRVPAFENLRLRSSWAGYYDYNTFDQNGIIGYHPNFSNVIIASGFSGHGLQQAAGVGRAITELILYGDYKSIDLNRMSFERVLLQQPLLETNIV